MMRLGVTAVDDFSVPCRMPVEQRRGYKNVFDALVRITREEGIGTLWRVSHSRS